MEKDMNSKEILEKENQPNMLKIQYASKYYFNKAELESKIIRSLEIVSILTVFLPNLVASDLVTSIQIIIDLLIVNLTSYFNDSIESAACLRNYFDSVVLDIHPQQYSESEVQKVHEKAEIVFLKNGNEALIQISNTGNDTPPGVKNWYDFTSDLTGLDAVFECQKQNIWWNEKIDEDRIKKRNLFYIIFFIFLFLLSIQLENSLLHTFLSLAVVALNTFIHKQTSDRYREKSIEINATKNNILLHPNIHQIVDLQRLINERRCLPILESNAYHNKNSANLSQLYQFSTSQKETSVEN